MGTTLKMKIGRVPDQGGVSLDQMALFSAISNEVCRQVPGLIAEPRLVNSMIDAANSLVAEFAKPIVKASVGMGLKAWLDSDDVGRSSEFMAWALSEHDKRILFWGRNPPRHAYPLDADDFGRCLRMVRAVPGFETRIDDMLEHGKHWKAVAENWDRWVELYDGDYGLTLRDEMRAAYGED